MFIKAAIANFARPTLFWLNCVLIEAHGSHAFSSIATASTSCQTCMRTMNFNQTKVGRATIADCRFNIWILIPLFAVYRVSPKSIQMQSIASNEKSSSQFIFPLFPVGLLSPEEPVDVRVSVCVLVFLTLFSHQQLCPDHSIHHSHSVLLLFFGWNIDDEF